MLKDKDVASKHLDSELDDYWKNKGKKDEAPAAENGEAAEEMEADT
jgi:hypothetical protein